MALFSKYVKEFSVVAAIGIGSNGIGSNGIGSNGHMDVNIQVYNGVVVANAISLRGKITMNRKRTSPLVATGTAVVTDADADVGVQDEATVASGTKRRVKAHEHHKQVKTPEIDEDWMEEIQVQVFDKMRENIAATIQDEDQHVEEEYATEQKGVSKHQDTEQQGQEDEVEIIPNIKALNSVVLKVFGTALITVSESEELSKKFATERHGHSQAAVFVTRRYALKTLRDILREESQSEESELRSRREVITKEAVRRLVWVLSMNLLLEEFWKVNPAQREPRHRFSIADMIGVGERVGVWPSLSDLSDPVIGLTISASELAASWPDFSKASKNVKQRALTLRREEEEKKSLERRERERASPPPCSSSPPSPSYPADSGGSSPSPSSRQFSSRSSCNPLSEEEKRQIIEKEKVLVTRVLQEIGKETLTKLFSHGPANQIPGAAGFEEQEAVWEEARRKEYAAGWIRNYSILWKRDNPLFWYNGLQDLDLPPDSILSKNQNYFVTMMQTVIQTGKCTEFAKAVEHIFQKAKVLIASSPEINMVEQDRIGFRSGGVHDYEIVEKYVHRNASCDSCSDETSEQRDRNSGIEREIESETTSHQSLFFDKFRKDHFWLEVQRVYVHPNGEKENIFSLTVDFWPMSQHQLAMQGDLPIVDSPENHFVGRPYSTAGATSTHPEADLEQQLQLSQEGHVLLQRILQGSLPDFDKMRWQGSMFLKNMIGDMVGLSSEMNQTILDRDKDCPTFQMDFGEFLQKYEKTFSTLSTTFFPSTSSPLVRRRTPGSPFLSSSPEKNSFVNPSDFWELQVVWEYMAKTYGLLGVHAMHYQALQATLPTSASAVGIGEQEKEEKEVRLYEFLQVKVAQWADIYGPFDTFSEMDKDTIFNRLLPDSKKCAEQREEQIKLRQGNLENPYLGSWSRPSRYAPEETPVIQALRRANETLKKQKQEQQAAAAAAEASTSIASPHLGVPSSLHLAVPVSRSPSATETDSTNTSCRYITDLVDIPPRWSSYVDRELRKCVVPEHLHRQNGITYDWYTGVTPLLVPAHEKNEGK